MSEENAMVDAENRVLPVTQAETDTDRELAAEPVAWLHTLHMELGQTAVSLTRNDGRDEHEPRRTAFGIPGRDYSEEFHVTSEPLFTRPPADPDNEGLAGARAHLEAAISEVDALSKAMSLLGRGDMQSPIETDILAPLRLALAALATAPRAEADTARVEEREACAKLADEWCAENKASAAKARKSISEGSQNMAEMLDGAAIECNAIAAAIRARTLSDGASNVDRG